MISKQVANTDSERLKCSWRYLSPSKASMQDRYTAFTLREKDGEREPALSFDVNTDSSISREDKHSEIYTIYDNKPNFDVSKNGRFIMVNISKAQAEANTFEERLNANIDGATHCSLYYMNNCYDIAFERLEVITFLIHNIEDTISTTRNDNNQMLLCKE